MKKSLFIISFLVYSILINSQNINYGLTFQSIDVNKDIRTGLDLTADESLNLSDGFTLEFDLKFHSEVFSYGYVFRIIEDNFISLDLITNTKLKTLYFVLNGKENIFSNIEFSKDIVKIDEWLHLKIVAAKKNIVFTVNGLSKEMPLSFKNMRHLDFLFGKNRHSLFYTSDVPSMTIKNLIIKDANSKIIRNWKMFKHGEDGVYDEEKNVRATVLNGKWVVDKYATWQKEITISTKDKNPQIAYDQKQNRLFMATNDSLIIYAIDQRQKQSIAVKKGNIFRSGGSHMIFDSKNDRLLSYSILYDNFITFDFKSQEWSSNQTDEGFPPLQQHNRLIDTVSNQLILFGGYGIHKYRAELFRHKLDGGNWQVKNLSDQITPRYLSSMVYLEKNKLLVLGGYGNASGKQEALSTNLYDLWEIDYKTYKCKKLAQFETASGDHFLFSNSMVVDKDNQLAHLLAYNNDRFYSSIRLMSFDWGKSQIKQLADSIPYNFLDIESFCDLVLDQKSQKFYALILQMGESNLYNVEIYSLNYPPLNSDDIYQKDLQTKSGIFFSRRNIIYLLIVAVLFILGISIVFYIRKKSISRKKTQNLFPERESISEDELIQKKEKNVGEFQKVVSSINFLRGFQVYDNSGNDITEDFTSVIKQLFLYIFLNTINEGKKITSEKINETFWLGMDKTSASNNRSVNVRKLRTLLEKVDGIEILNKNSYWYASVDERLGCDYLQVVSLMKKIKEQNTFNKSQLQAVLDIALTGVLLPNISVDWLDDFKSDYSNSIIDIFTKAMEQSDIRDDLKLMLRISNLILLHDSIDESAIKNKCIVLYKLGQKGSSKLCYERFYAEYEKILNTKPDFTYKNILNDI